MADQFFVTEFVANVEGTVSSPSNATVVQGQNVTVQSAVLNHAPDPR